MKKNVIAPRLTTPGPPTSSQSSVRLPDDVIADQVARLRLFALVSGGMWLMGLLMDGVVFPLALGAPINPPTLWIEVAAVLFAATVYFHTCYSARAPRSKADAGLVLMLLNSVGIALLETWARPPTYYAPGQLSWIPIVILLSAVVMPGRPRPMLIAAFISASMGPARRVVRAPARRRCPVGGRNADHGDTQLHLRDRGGAAVADVSEDGPAHQRGARAGQLRADRTTRPGRHGRRVAGAPSPAGPRRRGQAGSRRRDGRHRGIIAGPAAAFRARSPGDRGPQFRSIPSACSTSGPPTMAASTT